MRGKTTRQATCTAITPDQKVPENHRIRRIRALVEPALKELSPVFEEMDAAIRRPSIPPEHVLKSTLLMTLYSVRSERQFCERLEYDLLFKWFMDLNLEGPAFDASSFSKSRERLLKRDVAGRFMQAVLEEAGRRRLLSEEHFTVDGPCWRHGRGSRASDRRTNRSRRRVEDETRSATSGGSLARTTPAFRRQMPKRGSTPRAVASLQSSVSSLMA